MLYEWFAWIRSGLGWFVEGIRYFILPGIKDSYGFIDFMSDINLYVVIAVFVLLTACVFIFRRHSILELLLNPRNYFAALVMFGIYMFFAQAEGIKLGSGYTLQFQSIVLPMAAKLFGPIIGSVISIILYMASFWLGKAPFSVNMLFISGISGIVYGWVLYERPTSLWRSVLAKLIVTVACNIMLYPHTLGMPENAELINAISQNISFNITQNLIMIPVHGVLIYFELLILRHVRMYLSDSHWTLKN